MEISKIIQFYCCCCSTRPDYQRLLLYSLPLVLVSITSQSRRKCKPRFVFIFICKRYLYFRPWWYMTLSRKLRLSPSPWRCGTEESTRPTTATAATCDGCVVCRKHQHSANRLESVRVASGSAPPPLMLMLLLLLYRGPRWTCGHTILLVTF